ncbi:MAG TPA: hypothetical protein VH592_05935 [Gemmataceae bacterium]|jgi:hypothetical protein
MTGAELRDLFLSPDFKQGLEEMSSYLASIMQERPIVYLLARCLWQRGYKFELEQKRHDLSVNGKRIEFKFNYDRCEKALADELKKSGDNLTAMRRNVEAGVNCKSWGVMARILADVCVKRPDIFIWVICSRDLSKVVSDDLKRICYWRPQRKWPYVSNGELLTVADFFLAKLHAERPFILLKQDIPTNGDFPSTYHFRICDFASQG